MEDLLNKDMTLYSTTEIEKVIQYICVRDEASALATLQALQKTLATREMPDTVRRYCCYQMLVTYLSGLKRNHIAVADADMERLLNFRDEEQLFSLLRESAVTGSNRSGEKDHTALLQRERLTAYIEENLTDYSLCLSSTAEHMHMSIYTLSRLFKDIMGQGFKEYVTARRLQLAFTLLQSTNRSVTDIAGAVGFENPTYFSSVFKKHYGFSPTKVKKNK